MILALESAPANPAVVVPSLEALMQNLCDRFYALSPLEAGLLVLPIGLVFLLFGFKLYKLLVSLVFAGIGAGLGGALAAGVGWSAILGTIAGALVLGLLAWPLHRIAWGLLGGAILGGAAVLLVSARSQDPILLAIVATVLFAGGFILTLLVMRPLIILVTAILGAAVLVQAILRLSLLWPSFGDPVTSMLQAKPYLLAILVALPAALGFLLQWRDTSAAAKASSKKKKAAAEEE